MRSAERTLENRCEMSSTRPAPSSSPDAARTARLGSGSREAVGSSRITNGASRKKARARATRCHCPTDRSVPPRNSRAKQGVVPARKGVEELVRARASAAAAIAAWSSSRSASPSPMLSAAELVPDEVLEDHRDAPAHRRPGRVAVQPSQGSAPLGGRGRRGAWPASSCPSRSHPRGRRPRRRRSASTCLRR